MILFDRGSLGPSWQAQGGRLSPGTPQTGNESVQRLDCAWDPRVTLRPGAINAHTHLYSGLAPLGMPSPARPPPPGPTSWSSFLTTTRCAIARYMARRKSRRRI